MPDVDSQGRPLGSPNYGASRPYHDSQGRPLGHPDYGSLKQATNQ